MARAVIAADPGQGGPVAAHPPTSGGPVDGAAAVARLIAGFIEDRDRERRRLFRAHLQATVRTASPLALDVAAWRGIDLPASLALLAPKLDWPWRRVRDTAAPAAAFRPLGHRPKGATLFRRLVDERWVRRRAAGMDGLVVQPPTRGGIVGFDLAGDCLSVYCALDGGFLRTIGARAWLTLRCDIPETVVMALAGARLDRVVEHPALSGRRYVVNRVESATRHLGPTIVFTARPVPFAMPWERLLAETVEDGETSYAAPYRRGI